MSEFQPDLPNYRKMSEPFPSADAANEALSKFLDGVSELRRLHKITDVGLTISVVVTYPDGHEGAGMTTAFYGSKMNEVPLFAFAFGKAQEERREETAKLLKGK